MQSEVRRKVRILCALVAVALLAIALPAQMVAQDGDDDPPGRAARLGHMEGSVSFQPAGESEWVEAIPNRPMTSGDKLWADRDSRAEVQLGSTSIHIGSSTGFSFLNLDDHTIQIQLSAGTINLRVRHLDDEDVVEIDTPNQAFSVFRQGNYRVESSEDGNYTVVTVREGEGESTGNGQTYTVHEGQRATFSGTERLSADVQQIGEPDEFDRWSYRRDRHYEESPSSRYVSRDVVGAEDLDEYGQWRSAPEYGNVWYPNVPVGWAPYHTGHWAWIDPWGWTWVDDAPWGYAPFHYGRWAFIEGRWGWVPGPPEVRPVYAPALVVFVGGGGPAMGGNVAWFPLGPREVYVPSYHVSQAYVNRVNVTNTNVSQTTVTNVFNTTVVNNTTVINNVSYANRNVSGAVTAVPQYAFAGGQSVAKVAVPVTRQQIAAAPVAARVAVAPSQTAVLGVHAANNVHVAAPPAAVLNRQVIAKTAPPPAPVPFAAKQQALAAHPGQPVERQEMQQIRPANAPQPLVRQVTPTKPGNSYGHPGNQPAANEHPGQNAQPHPQPKQPVMSQPAEPSRPAQPNTPAMNRPAEPNRPTEYQGRNDRPSPAQPSYRPEVNPSVTNRPAEPRNDHPVVQPTSHTISSAPVQNVAPAEAPRQAVAPSRPQNPAPATHPQPSAPAPAAAGPSQPQPQQHPQPGSKSQGSDDKKPQDHK